MTALNKCQCQVLDSNAVEGNAVPGMIIIHPTNNLRFSGLEVVSRRDYQ